MTDAEYVTVESAGHLTGIPARTLRRWIADGKLPATMAGRRRLVAIADVRIVAAMAGRLVATAAMAEEVAGHVAAATAGHDGGDGDGEAAIGQAVAVSPAASAQLAAIRDEWLRPLVDELSAKAERIGRLEERLATTERERDALKAENDALRAGEDAPNKSPKNQGEAIGADQGPESSPGSAPQRGVQRSWWRFWGRR